MQETLRRQRRRTFRTLLDACPPAQPASALDPALEVSRGAVAAYAAKHEAGGFDPGRIEPRRTGRIAPRFDDREVKLALNRLKELEHVRGVAGRGELSPQPVPARCGAEIL